MSEKDNVRAALEYLKAENEQDLAQVSRYLHEGFRSQNPSTPEPLDKTVGFGVLTPTGARLARLDKDSGDPPTQEQATLLARLGRRMQVLGWVDFALVFVAVATMPLARFI